MSLPYYLDYAATTPCDPEVVAYMLPYFSDHFGNPASRFHRYGWEAEEAVTKARVEISRLIGAKPGEVIFTSGATESANLAIRGLLKAMPAGHKHIITLSTEHKCVLETLQQLEKEGFTTSFVGVNESGLPDPSELDDSFRPETALVCAMYANNETGVVMPVHSISELARKHGAFFFCDATQAVGKIPVNVSADGMDMMSFTAHKMYGPKGIGALYIKGGTNGFSLLPQITGGRHEQGLRGGTLNLPGIAGFGKAAQLCLKQMEKDSERITGQRQLLEKVLARVQGLRLNGDPQHRLPHITNISIDHVDSERLLLSLSSKLALGYGSACSSITREPSHVLRAMGVSPELLNSSIRISQGRFTTRDQITFAATEIERAIAKIRQEAVVG